MYNLSCISVPSIIGSVVLHSSFLFQDRRYTKETLFRRYADPEKFRKRISVANNKAGAIVARLASPLIDITLENSFEPVEDQAGEAMLMATRRSCALV